MIVVKGQIILQLGIVENILTRDYNQEDQPCLKRGSGPAMSIGGGAGGNMSELIVFSMDDCRDGTLVSFYCCDKTP